MLQEIQADPPPGWYTVQFPSLFVPNVTTVNVVCDKKILHSYVAIDLGPVTVLLDFLALIWQADDGCMATVQPGPEGRA
jgi:hypothetical protein